LTDDVDSCYFIAAFILFYCTCADGFTLNAKASSLKIQSRFNAASVNKDNCIDFGVLLLCTISSASVIQSWVFVASL